MTSSTTTSCRACQTALTTILPFGEMPLANALVNPAAASRDEARYALTLAFCPNCTLIQILETIPPAELFSDYVYFSSFSESWLKHARDAALQVIDQARLGPDSLVVEIASNDGYLLQQLRRAWYSGARHRARHKTRRRGGTGRRSDLVEFFE